MAAIPAAVTSARSTPRLAPTAVAVAAGVSVLLLVCTLAGPYGFFIDELYYLACARRLAWGYVDHPPLSIAVLTATRALMGEAIAAVRLPPALAAGAAAL